MQSSPDAPNLAGLKLQASVHGNIAVKPLPIRLLALCTAALLVRCSKWPRLHLAYCSAQSGRLTALIQSIIARLHASSHRGTIAESFEHRDNAVRGLPQPSCKK